MRPGIRPMLTMPADRPLRWCIINLHHWESLLVGILSGRNQCSEAVKKANRMLGMIKRNFIDRSKETIISLYKSLVRPHLEYCCQIWCPYYNRDIKLIEGVQRRATKLVTGMKELHYSERLRQLGLQWLEGQKMRSNRIETFKIVKGDMQWFFGC